LCPELVEGRFDRLSERCDGLSERFDGLSERFSGPIAFPQGQPLAPKRSTRTWAASTPTASSRSLAPAAKAAEPQTK
jgi:hypothetical protein